jgi:hypothetical protein
MEELVWKPRFKNQTPKNETNTTRLAAQALNDIRKMERMRSNGTLDQYLQEMKPKKQTKKFNKKLLFLLPLPLLVLPFLPFLYDHTHQVSGRLRNEKSALHEARITLHGEQTKETNSDQEGKFTVKGVEPGNYKITVQHQNSDPKYADPNTTPFNISVQKDIENLNVFARIKMPAQKK